MPSADEISSPQARMSQTQVESALWNRSMEKNEKYFEKRHKMGKLEEVFSGAFRYTESNAHT